MKKIFYLSKLLYIALAMLCFYAVQAQRVPGKHQKQLPASRQPAFAKGVVMIKLSRAYENVLASKRANVSQFGIKKLDSVLQTLKVKASRQALAELFEPGFNERSAANANRALAAKKLPLLTAEILDKRHKEFGFHLWYRLQFDSTVYLRPILQKLQSLKGIVDIAEPVAIPSPAAFNDPYYTDQYALKNTGQNGGKPGADIKAEQAWTITTGDSNVVVAVSDDGININHEDLAASMWSGKGRSFVPGVDTLYTEGWDHGTWVAGVIGARSNNGIGISGVAGGDGSSTSGARLMACRIAGSDYDRSDNRSAAFVYAADNGAAINNYSWISFSSYVYREALFIDAERYFSKYGGGSAVKGGVTVWAAGNQNISTQTATASYDVDNQMVVAATENNDTKCDFSNYGDYMDISAPGRGIYTTTNVPSSDALYGAYDGTSAAAPIVSGVAALVASVAPGRFTADEITGIVLSTADNIDSLNPGYEGKLGSGRVNAYAAVLKAQQIAAQPLLDTVSATSVTRTCNGYTVAYTKNAANSDVMIAVGLSRKFDFPNGHVYNVGDNIGKGAKVVYKGGASSFTLSQILKDSARHYFKIWSVNGSNYSGGTVLHADSSYYTLRNPSATQGADNVAISFGKVCPNSDVMVVVNSLPQFGKPQGVLNAGSSIVGGGTVLYKGSAAGFTHTGLASGSYYYALYPVIDTAYGMGKYLGGYCFGVTGVPLPVKTSFEEPGVPQNIALFTPSQSEYGWKTGHSGAGSTGTGYVYADNYLNYLPEAWGEVSYVQTAPINVTSSDSVICRFAHAASTYDSSILTSIGIDYNQYIDTLTVLVSADCGQTWQTAWKKWGYDLGTMVQDPAAFLHYPPHSSSDWAQDRVNLTSFIPAGAGSILVAFKNTSQSGINIYLDDINIYKVLHNDAGIASVVFPASDACSSTFSPKVAITNLGINPLTSATIHYSIDGGAVQSFNWSGNKAYEQKDTVTLPAITATPGNHTLTVYTSLPNAVADEVISNDTAYGSFRVLDPIVLAENAVSTESFENPGFVPDQWRLADTLKPYNWMRISPDGYPGFVAAADTSAAFVNTYDNNNVGEKLDLYSPVYNTGGADTARLIFSRAAADYNGTGATTDSLEVLLTTDCGETFTTIYSKTGADLTTSPVTDFFYPTSLEEWKADTVDISSLVRNAGDYRFVFRVINTYNNNVLIDNVQVQTKGEGALPIKLISFTGTRNGAANELQWKTGSLPAATFTVQRSTNGRDFTSIGTVNALSGTIGTSFSFSDRNLQASQYYYRLMMTEAGGQVSYSNIILLAGNANGLQITSFYPSPLKGNTGYLSISSDKAKTVRIVVTDMAGRKIKMQTVSVITGSNTIPLTFGNLAAGTYLLRVLDEKNGAVTMKFVKE